MNRKLEQDKESMKINLPLVEEAIDSMPTVLLTITYEYAKSAPGIVLRTRCWMKKAKRNWVDHVECGRDGTLYFVHPGHIPRILLPDRKQFSRLPEFRQNVQGVCRSSTGDIFMIRADKIYKLIRDANEYWVPFPPCLYNWTTQDTHPTTKTPRTRLAVFGADIIGFSNAHPMTIMKYNTITQTSASLGARIPFAVYRRQIYAVLSSDQSHVICIVFVPVRVGNNRRSYDAVDDTHLPLKWEWCIHRVDVSGSNLRVTHRTGGAGTLVDACARGNMVSVLVREEASPSDLTLKFLSGRNLNVEYSGVLSRESHPISYWSWMRRFQEITLDVYGNIILCTDDERKKRIAHITGMF
jgi:hypothetical protein